MKLQKTAFWILSFRTKSGKTSKDIFSHTQSILISFQCKMFFLLLQYCLFYIYLRIEKDWKTPSIPSSTMCTAMKNDPSLCLSHEGPAPCVAQPSLPTAPTWARGQRQSWGTAAGHRPTSAHSTVPKGRKVKQNNSVNSGWFPAFSWILENKNPEVGQEYFLLIFFFFFQEMKYLEKNCLILPENKPRHSAIWKDSQIL